MSEQTLDELELELRRLNGVRSAGFDEHDNLLVVQVHVASSKGNPALPLQATRVAARHSDRPVAVEVVRWRESAPTNALADTEALGIETGGRPMTGEKAPATVHGGGRARLLAVLSFPDTGEVEVHLIQGGRRTIGRAPTDGGINSVIDATIEALDGLDSPLSPRTLWARELDGGGEGTALVAVALESDDVVYYGLAPGTSQLEATARSALDALNRRLSAIS